jgi:hypothetical protein
VGRSGWHFREQKGAYIRREIQGRPFRDTWRLCTRASLSRPSNQALLCFRIVFTFLTVRSPTSHCPHIRLAGLCPSRGCPRGNLCVLWPQWAQSGRPCSIPNTPLLIIILSSPWKIQRASEYNLYSLAGNLVVLQCTSRAHFEGGEGDNTHSASTSSFHPPRWVVQWLLVLK